MTETDITIRELRRRFGEGSLSPLEYWLALETHIEAWEPSICALYAYDPEAARKQAQASTERWRKGETLGASGWRSGDAEGTDCHKGAARAARHQGGGA